MGENQSKIIKQQTLRSQHPAFNNAKIITSIENKYIESTFLTKNESYDLWISQMQKGKKKLKSDYLLLPNKTTYTHNQGLCGDFGSLKYPYYPYLLSQIIKNKKQNNSYFSQGQLWYMLYVLTLALKEIKSYSNKLGDIKPENIFLDDQGKIKIGNIYSWPDQLPSFIKATDQLNIMYNGLLAPQDLEQLQRGSLNNDQNESSEIFAIGATLISAGQLKDFSEIYNYQNKTFNVPAFKNKRRQWGQNGYYTDIFKSIILNLVDKNPGMRLSSQQLWQFVSQFTKDILERRKFIIKTVPGKIQMSFNALNSQNY